MRGSAGVMPSRVALGRWENEETFWQLLVERWRLPHLAIPGDPGSNPVRDALALGQHVFEGVSLLPFRERPFETLKRTEAFLRSPHLRAIYFDVTDIASSSKRPAVPADGYYARKELELVVVDLDLFRKTRFFECGAPLWRNGATWRGILTLRSARPIRPRLFFRNNQRRYLDELLEQ